MARRRMIGAHVVQMQTHLSVVNTSMVSFQRPAFSMASVTFATAESRRLTIPAYVRRSKSTISGKVALISIKSKGGMS